MEYTPKVPITPKLNSVTIIQKDGIATRGKNDASRGDSPGKSCIVGNLKKLMPNKMEVVPITTRTLLHESHNSKPSHIIGASRKLKFGAVHEYRLPFPSFYC